MAATAQMLLLQSLKAVPKIAIAQCDLPVFKAVVHAIETPDSARRRWPTCAPTVFTRAIACATIPAGATIIAPRQDRGPPLFLRSNGIRIDRILAPISSGGAIACASARSPIHDFEYVVGHVYTSDLDTDTARIFGRGFHVFTSFWDTITWAEFTLGDPWVNDSADVYPWVGRVAVSMPGH